MSLNRNSSVPLNHRQQLRRGVTTKVATPEVPKHTRKEEMLQHEETYPDPRPTTGSSKHVSFAPSVRVVLVPHRKDYKEAGLLSVLWYSEEELKRMQHAAYLEMNCMLLKGETYISSAHLTVHESSDSASIDRAKSFLDKMGEMLLNYGRLRAGANYHVHRRLQA